MYIHAEKTTPLFQCKKAQNQSNLKSKNSNMRNIRNSHRVKTRRGYDTGASDHLATSREPRLISRVHFGSVKQLYKHLEKTTPPTMCKKIKIPDFLLEIRGFLTKTTPQLFSMI